MVDNGKVAKMIRDQLHGDIAESLHNCTDLITNITGSEECEVVYNRGTHPGTILLKTDRGDYLVTLTVEALPTKTKEGG